MPGSAKGSATSQGWQAQVYTCGTWTGMKAATRHARFCQRCASGDQVLAGMLAGHHDGDKL